MDLSQSGFFLFAGVCFAAAAIAFAISGNLILAIAVASMSAGLVVVSTQQSTQHSDIHDT